MEFPCTLGGYTDRNKYLYNNKEIQDDSTSVDNNQDGIPDFTLQLYDYGKRNYDPALGRFIEIDPIAEDYYHVSTYNYAENDPVGAIDLWGLQKIKISDTRNSQRQVTNRQANVSVNMKVFNLSSQGDFMFNGSLGRAGNKASRSFSTSFSSRVLDSPQKGLTDKQVPVNVSFNLSVKQVSSLSQVSETDFVAIIVNSVDNGSENGNVAGWGELDGNKIIVEASQMTGSSSEVLLHELGHNLDLDFGGSPHTSDGKGLMGANLNGQTSILKSALKSMYQGMPVTGKSHQKTHDNSKSTIQEYLKENARDYDKSKAKKAGF